MIQKTVSGVSLLGCGDLDDKNGVHGLVADQLDPELAARAADVGEEVCFWLFGDPVLYRVAATSSGPRPPAPRVRDPVASLVRVPPHGEPTITK